MNDDVIEMFIKARKNRTLAFRIILIFAVTLLIDVAIFMFIGLIGFYLSLIITGIAVFGVIIMVRMGRLEYEISIVKGEMRISEIRNQSMRKKILNFEIRDIENFREAKPEDVFADNNKDKDKEHQHKLLCCFGDDDKDIYFFNARAMEEGVTYNIYFAPDSRIKREFADRNFEARKVLSKQRQFED